MTVLEVGFEQVRELAAPLNALLDADPQFLEATRRQRPPVTEHRLTQGLGERVITCDGASVEKAEHHLDFLRGQTSSLSRHAHRVVKLDSAVPHGIPEPVRDCNDI